LVIGFGLVLDIGGSWGSLTLDKEIRGACVHGELVGKPCDFEVKGET
jgi:hypothetical protein